MGGGPGPIPPSGLGRLTARKREIQEMFASGMYYREIAQVRGNSNSLKVGNAVYREQKKLEREPANN